MKKQNKKKYCSKCKKITEHTKIQGFVYGRFFDCYYCIICLEIDLKKFMNSILKCLQKKND